MFANPTYNEFLLNISHELIPIAHAIIDHTDTLLSSDLNPGQRSGLKTVMMSSNSLLEVVSDLLEFTKLELSDATTEIREFQIEGVVKEVVSLLSSQAKKKGLKLVYRIHRSVPATLRGKPQRMRHILIQLIKNTICFSSNGEIMVLAVLEKEDACQVFIRFAVSGSGVGNGLKLAISKQLTESMNGSLDIETKSGVGSTFQFTIPFEKILPRVENANPKKNIRILIVEDNEIPRKLTAEILNAAGYGCIDTVGSAAEAFRMLKARPYDIVLIDVQMPDINGIEAAKIIRSSEFGELNRYVPIIAMTAATAPEAQKACQEAGMNDFILKPVFSQQLLNIIAKYHSVHDRVSSTSGQETQRTVDWQPALNRLGGRDDLLKDLVKDFIEDFPKKLSSLQRAISREDVQEIKFVAHSLKGNAAIVDAESIRDIAVQIETHLIDRNFKDIERLVHQLNTEFQQVKAAFERRRRSSERIPSINECLKP